jgi:flagellar biosynthesis/type III secretory pathway protein FliH
MTTRRVSLDEIPDLVPKDRPFVETSHGGPVRENEFVAWGRSKFREIKPEETITPPSPDEGGVEQAGEEPPIEPAAEEAPQPEVQIEVPPPPPPLPPPVDEDPPPSAQEILDAIEKAREEGRATGYAQGVAASRQELSEAVLALRSLAAELPVLADEVRQHAAAMMAQHVRRIAQDLAGTVFAEIPDAFLERIRRSAELFVRANSEFSLFVSHHDLKALTKALAGEEIFNDIKISADPDLMRGAFRLSSRDLEVVDTPVIEGGEEDQT